MYTKLVVGKDNNLSIEEYDQKLRNLGHITFKNISDKDIELLKSSENIRDFIFNFFYFSNRYPSARWSNRYQRYVKAEVSRAGANRSTMDIFMTCLAYCPHLADLKAFYTELMTIFIRNSNLIHSICPTILRRVWAWRGSTTKADMHRSTEKDVTHRGNIHHFGQKDELGVTIEYNQRDRDNPYQIYDCTTGPNVSK